MVGGRTLPDVLFCSLFPAQKTTSRIGHRGKQFFRVVKQYAECEKQQQQPQCTVTVVVVVVVFFTLTDRASANPVGGLLDRKTVRGTSTKLQRDHENKNKTKTKQKQK